MKGKVSVSADLGLVVASLACVGLFFVLKQKRQQALSVGKFRLADVDRLLDASDKLRHDSVIRMSIKSDLVKSGLMEEDYRPGDIGYGYRS